MTVDCEIRVAASPERVFTAVSDPTTWKDWIPSLVSLEMLTDGPLAVGSRWRETRKMFGKEATEEFELTHFDPPRSFKLHCDGSKGTSGKGEYHFQYDVVPDGDGSLVKMHGDIDMPGMLAGIMGKMFAGMFKKELQKDLEAMKAWVEKG